MGICPKYFAGKCQKFAGFCPKFVLEFFGANNADIAKLRPLSLLKLLKLQ